MFDAADPAGDTPDVYTCDTFPVDEDQVEEARRAWRRFGRGRYAAGLNYGDLFSYALARTTGQPLLFKGDDFTRTDVAACTTRSRSGRDRGHAVGVT